MNKFFVFAFAVAAVAGINAQTTEIEVVEIVKTEETKIVEVVKAPAEVVVAEVIEIA